MSRFFNLTPAERNRIRQMRELLTEYERNPQPSTAAAINRTAADLTTAGIEADEARRQEADRNAAEALASAFEGTGGSLKPVSTDSPAHPINDPR